MRKKPPKKDRWSPGSYYLAAIFNLTLISSLVTMCNPLLIRCTVDEDCPRGARCFKDECARCLCPEGHHVVNFYDGVKLIKICQKEVGPLQVNDLCIDEDRECPVGSYCDPLTSVCVCEDGLRPHPDNSHCRQGLYNERCSRHMGCEDFLGLRCRGHPPTCKCKMSFHRPSSWTAYVLRRWDYSQVQGEPQECVTRVIGEPCSNDRDCAGVKGTGAICNPCKFCQCRLPQHTADLLGAKCGPPLEMDQTCSIGQGYVCDGAKGLQCGDVCDIYNMDTRKKKCTCSQMHDYINGQCLPKRVASPCTTDLDCYPVKEGFGFCERGRCTVDVSAAGPRFTPFLSSRVCNPPDVPPVGGGTSGGKRHSRNGSTEVHPDDRWWQRQPGTVNFENYTNVIRAPSPTKNALEESDEFFRSFAKSDQRKSASSASRIGCQHKDFLFNSISLLWSFYLSLTFFSMWDILLIFDR